MSYFIYINKSIKCSCAKKGLEKNRNASYEGFIYSSAFSNSLSKRKVLEIKGKIHTNKPTTVIKARRKPKIAKKPPVTSPS